MSNSEILNRDPTSPDYGKILPQFIPGGGPAATPTLSQVLSAGNDTGGQDIVSLAGDVYAQVMETGALRALGAPINSIVALQADLDGANLANLQNIRQVSFDSTAAAPTHYSINGVYNIDSGAIPFPVARFSASKAGGTQQKSLTLELTDGEAIWSQQWEGYVPGSIRTKQNVFTIDGQGTGALTDIKCDTVNITPNFGSAATLDVSGSISATSLTANGGDIITDGGILISKDGSQPRTEYQDSTGAAQMEVGWNSITGRGVLRSSQFEAFSDNTKKYLVNWGDNIGYLGLETQGVDTEIRHYNAGATVMETRVKVEDGGKVSITEGQGQTATLRLENNGGKGGEIIASETGGFMAIQAQAGYNLTMESTAGNVSVASANADTNVAITTNGGTASIAAADAGGVGNINISATDSGTGTTNSLLVDPTANAMTATAGSLTLNGSIITAFNGAVEGAEMGYDIGSLNNFVAGLGTVFDVKQSRYDPKVIRFENTPTNKITANADNGSIELLADSGAIGTKLEVGTAFTGVLNGTNPDTGLSVSGGGNPTAQLIIDSATAKAGLKYDGTATNPVQFHFDGADFISGTSGGSSGQHLRIFVNGTEYKIKLELP